MPARKTYTAAEVEHIGVPAYHPKGFWYDPVAAKQRLLVWTLPQVGSLLS